MNIARAHLEDWLRDRYFEAKIDLGSSGVKPFTLGELCKITELDITQLNETILGDGHSHGCATIRTSIARRWADCDADKVMVTNGSSEAIFLLMNTLLHENDEVIVLDPIYHSLKSIPEALGCKVKRWKLNFANNFKINIDEGFELITPKTKMVVLNSPHNPTGTAVDDATFNKLVSYIENNGSWLVLDNSFSELHWSSPPFSTIAHKGEHVVQVGTLSKAYGLPGLRLGWCIASPNVISKMTPLKDVVSLFVSPLTELISIAAIDKAEVILDIRRGQAKTNLNELQLWISSYDNIVEYVSPQGGVTVFPKFHSIKNVDGFCKKLLIEFDTLVVPGSCFGWDQHVRLGFGGDVKLFTKGLDRKAFRDALHIYTFEEERCPNSRVDLVAAKKLPRRAHS